MSGVGVIDAAVLVVTADVVVVGVAVSVFVLVRGVVGLAVDRDEQAAPLIVHFDLSAGWPLAEQTLL